MTQPNPVLAAALLETGAVVAALDTAITEIKAKLALGQS